MEPVLYSDCLVKLLGEDCLHALKCSICLEFFDNPIVLNCGHTFCLTCIQNTTNYVLCQNPHLPPWKVFVNCPECRKPFNANKLSKKGPSLSSNYPVASILEILKGITVPLKIDASTNTEDHFKQNDVETQTCDLQADKEREILELNKKQIDELEQRVHELCLLGKAHFEKMRKEKRRSCCPCPNRVDDQSANSQHINKAANEHHIKQRKRAQTRETTYNLRSSASNLNVSKPDAKIKHLAKFIDDSEILRRQKHSPRLNQHKQ